MDTIPSYASDEVEATLSDLFDITDFLSQALEGIKVNQKVDRGIVVTLERLIPDALPRHAPANSFTTSPSTQNLSVAIESFTAQIGKTIRQILAALKKMVMRVLEWLKDFFRKATDRQRATAKNQRQQLYYLEARRKAESQLRSPSRDKVVKAVHEARKKLDVTFAHQLHPLQNGLVDDGIKHGRLLKTYELVSEGYGELFHFNSDRIQRYYDMINRLLQISGADKDNDNYMRRKGDDFHSHKTRLYGKLAPLWHDVNPIQDQFESEGRLYTVIRDEAAMAHAKPVQGITVEKVLGAPIAHIAILDQKAINDWMVLAAKFIPKIKDTPENLQLSEATLKVYRREARELHHILLGMVSMEEFIKLYIGTKYYISDLAWRVERELFLAAVQAAKNDPEAAAVYNEVVAELNLNLRKF